jgi:CelD/BcsL family acetyltransferase involved in cellulose biosynthesis
MLINRITSTDEFNTLAGEWNALLSCCSASHVPFLRHEYLATWWQTLGGGEWDTADLNIITIRDDQGELTTIAPLFFSRNRDGVPALLLLGSIEISDYLDLITQTDSIEQNVFELLNYLVTGDVPDWEVLDLYNILEDSPTIPALQTAAEKLGLRFSSNQLQHCPYIPLPGDWESYLANINKKQRHEIRRKMRRASEHNIPVNWYIVDDETALDSEIDDFLHLMSQDPEKDNFLTGVMRSQMRSAVHAAYKAGWLQLSFLQVGEQKAAGYLNFDFAGHLWVYNSGINFDHQELSPGWVLLGHLLKWANENERQFFDFMRGDEEYKYRFGAVDRFIFRVQVSR